MNIYDIAKLANVSIATVSRVVNNQYESQPEDKRKGSCGYERKMNTRRMRLPEALVLVDENSRNHLSKY